MISLQEVSRSFTQGDSRLQAVDRVTLEIAAGEIHGIMGASGAGKSTLLRMINLLERPDAGKVFVGGQELTVLSASALRQARRSIGMIFQHFNLVGNRTVEGNVGMPLELSGVRRPERQQRTEELLRYVGLLEKKHQYPASLSGGQKQRVAIARALISRPKVLLCDEPTSALDERTASSILELLKEVHASGVTIVMVTHERSVIDRMCSHVSVMEHGRILRTAPVKESYP
ncbi:ATP-binding cassette domain-containing protein [Paenibacillus sp. F411]|uniref:methionine ABC transporter ATP-binding protein n=1 Tax=unclassified Paenibacillus TaxID=185978 RepID=UPI001AAF499E|nr:ATP-binding cassette domain-containing protein [Paenibacillus sp. F411]